MDLSSPFLDTRLSTTEIQVLNVLQDIVLNVQIQENFSILHPDYLPVVLPEAAAVRFQQLSADLQHQYLKLKLSLMLHDLYFVGSQTIEDVAEGSVEVEKNAGTMEQDWGFCNSLHTRNDGTGYFDPGWVVHKEAEDGSLIVQKQELTLHIWRDRHLQEIELSPCQGDIVSIRMPPNLFEQGYYIAVGNAGLANGSYPPNPVGTLSIYFNLSPAGAVVVMGQLTQSLNQSSIPFTFKVRYDPADFHRYSTAILSCQPRHYNAIRPILEAIYAECRRYFRPEVPLFAKYLAPGLAIAEEPLSSDNASQPFGIHRCQLVASGLLAAWNVGDDTLDGRVAAIQQEFSALGLVWQRPYLNANSEDIYSFLD